MKINVNDVLKKSAILLNKSEFATYLNGGYHSTMVASEEDLEEEKRTFVYCFLEVYTEIACDYHPLYFTETINVQSNQFDLTTLSRKFKSVKSILDENNCEVLDYYIEYDYLHIKNGTYKLKYRFIPQLLDVLDDEAQNFEGKVSESLMAYGTCAYYCLMYNLSDLYDLWETKYKQSLLISMQKTENLYIKPRSFI